MRTEILDKHMTQEHFPSPDLFDPPSPSEMLTARRVALAILQRIFDKHHTIDQVFDDSKEFSSLSQRDRAFVRMLVTTVIRRLGQIDDLIRRALSKPDQPLNPPVLGYILRLGVAQLIFMNIPDHAAVNTSVLLAEVEGHIRMKGFVNAILRRIAAEGKDWESKQDIPRLNTPEWLLKNWIQDYGLRTALEIAMSNLQEAALDVTLKDEAQREHWAQTLGGEALPTGGVRLTHARMITELPGFEDGMWWVQDAAASLPAQLFGTNIAGASVLDLCAAPGGKTAQLASMGANVVALDRSAKRIQRLQSNMKRMRLGHSVRTEIADAAVWRSREQFPYILLDAPCSATGTIRRNPDVLWMKSEGDLNSLVDLQARLLENALSMLQPGGVLVYCTCSLQKCEGENQIDRLIERRDDVDRIPIQASEVGEIRDFITPRGDVRILPTYLPEIGGIDGFYIARLGKAL
ncbi:MAG: 16S rRNA (cytosine(967)-C(5))-methyltransferase RsmB [Pseudobdellovibrionaceae bacterium]|nr:16S rRNA (cytosine(967)-C(5))-methyltransferase RsmB [Pseudobdellovibrionaceae bacterium]